MKKVVCLIAVLALTASVNAGVVITAAEGTGANDNKLVLSYTADAGDELVGLAVVLDAGTGGDTIKVTSGWAIDSFFDVFIDAYKTDPAKLDDTTFGDDGTTPFADTEGPGQVTTDSAKVSLCVAALPADHVGKASSAELAVIDVNDGDADGEVTVCVTLDTLRGGPVDIEGAVAATINGSCVTIVLAAPECLKNTATEYTAWETFGKPACWCFPRQCRGDFNGTKQGTYWVYSQDLTGLKDAYQKSVAQMTGNRICADFNHSAQGSYRVYSQDLSILKTYYQKPATTATCCDANNDCVLDASDKFNFWTGAIN